MKFVLVVIEHANVKTGEFVRQPDSVFAYTRDVGEAHQFDSSAAAVAAVERRNTGAPNVRARFAIVPVDVPAPVPPVRALI